MKSYRASMLVLLCVLLAACAIAVSSIEQHGPVYRIAVPTTGLLLEFPSDGFTLQMADDSRPYYYLTNATTKLNVSFNFARTTKCSSSESCREYFVTKLKMVDPDKKNWQMSRVGDVLVSENMDGGVTGFLKQQHMNAHLVKEGVWIDVHLSKVNYREADRELFVNFVRSLRVKPKT